VPTCRQHVISGPEEPFLPQDMTQQRRQPPSDASHGNCNLHRRPAIPLCPFKRRASFRPPAAELARRFGKVYLRLLIADVCSQHHRQSFTRTTLPGRYSSVPTRYTPAFLHSQTEDCASHHRYTHHRSRPRPKNSLSKSANRRLLPSLSHPTVPTPVYPLRITRAHLGQ
jgi:hypothetical protein